MEGYIACSGSLGRRKREKAFVALHNQEYIHLLESLERDDADVLTILLNSD